MLCDLASTAYYIGGVVESQIGKAAPWFILAVMVFSEDLKLLTAVVNRAEVAGKPVKPLVILTGDPQSELLRAVRGVGAKELLLSPSGPEAPDTQIDRIAARFTEQTNGEPSNLTIRLIAEGQDERLVIGAGSAIPSAPDEDGETARMLAGTGTD